MGDVGGLWKKETAFFFQAEDGIRDLCLSRGLGEVYKGQLQYRGNTALPGTCRTGPADAWYTLQ